MLGEWNRGSQVPLGLTAALSQKIHCSQYPHPLSKQCPTTTETVCQQSTQTCTKQFIKWGRSRYLRQPCKVSSCAARCASDFAGGNVLQKCPLLKLLHRNCYFFPLISVQVSQTFFFFIITISKVQDLFISSYLSWNHLYIPVDTWLILFL